MLSNAYFLAKFRFDTAENERNFAKHFPKKISNYPTLPYLASPVTRSGGTGRAAGASLPLRRGGRLARRLELPLAHGPRKKRDVH